MAEMDEGEQAKTAKIAEAIIREAAEEAEAVIRSGADSAARRDAEHFLAVGMIGGSEAAAEVAKRLRDEGFLT